MDPRAEAIRDALRALDPSMAQRVYYQPPTGYVLQYPCIVFEGNERPTKFANNRPYGWVNTYTITYISNDADDPILDSIGMMPHCKFDRQFVNDNLYHYVYHIY